MNKKILFILSFLTFSFSAVGAAAQESPFFKAIADGDTAAVAKAMSDGAAVNQVSDKGASPLYVAVRNQHYDIAKMLIDQGADVNAANAQAIGATPLMIAASRPNLDLTVLLLENGADIDVVDVNNDPAINWAAYYGFTDIIETLIAHGARTDIAGHGTPRQIAIRRGHQDLVALLSDHAVTPGARDLLVAIEAEDLDAFERALDGGASPDALDNTGRPILGLLARAGMLRFMEALVDAGAQIDLKDDIGFTALMEAAREGESDAVQYLIAVGADVNHRADASALSYYPMHLAALSDSSEVIGALADAGASLDAPDRDDAPPLMWALSEGKMASSIKLLELGADPHVKTVNGFSAADMIAGMEDERLSALVKPE